MAGGGTRRAHPVAVAAAAVACLLTATACADENPRATGSEQAAPRPLGDKERELLHDTEQALLRQCMRQAGFRLWKVPLKPVPEQREFPYAVDDVKWAREHGYGSDIRQRAERLRTQDPNRRYFEGLTAERKAAAKAALHGRDRRGGPSVTLPGGGVARRSGDGCTAQAQTRLYGDFARWFRTKTFTDNLTGLRMARVSAEPAFRKAVKDWSSCMRGKGHAYNDPEQARRAFSTPAAGKTAAAAGGDRSAEVGTAVAEAECARGSGLSEVAGRLHRRHGERLRAEYREQVNERLRLEQAALLRVPALSSSR
ncbi:hypothetical protein ACFUKV_20430 [Streptomyces paradoxus]|uniref:hypothetical protein n=1 Tax=Streptomyces paradoxus TaxID=66375 RepID=UPI00363F01F1